MGKPTRPLEPHLITSSVAAELLGCSRRTVCNMASDGRLEPVGKLAWRNGAYVFLRADVVAYADTRKASA